jgi:hypothetical protein
MGRADLIGPGKHHLVPPWQPAGTGLSGGEGKRTGKKHGTQTFTTKGVPVRDASGKRHGFGTGGWAKGGHGYTEASRKTNPGRTKPSTKS